MATYPETPRSALLDWCRVHDPIFFDNWKQIGLGKTQVVTFRTSVGSAAAASLEQERTRQAALAATQEAEQSFAELAAAAGDAVRSIRAFAANAADPDAVYCLAQIPPTAGPSPIGPPGRPSGLTATLDAATGGLTLRWKNKNPPNARRTTYIVRRKLPGETQFQFVGTTGTKRFVDDTLVVGARVRDPVTLAASRAGGILEAERRGKGFPQEWVREGSLAPAGEGILAPAVQYTIQGQRANLSGPVSPVFNVNFGKAAIQSKADGRKAKVESRQSTAGGRGKAVVASVTT